MESNKQKRKFDKPLIVYRINTDEITEIMKEMAKYLIGAKYVEYIFIENLDEIKENDFKNDEKKK